MWKGLLEFVLMAHIELHELTKAAKFAKVPAAKCTQIIRRPIERHLSISAASPCYRS